MRVLIYGGGAVGLGIASCLLKAGMKVTILARPGTAMSLQQKGLSRTGIFGTYAAQAGTFGVGSSLDDFPGQQFEYILVCTKSFDSETVAADIAAHPACFTLHSGIVLFQNGWGNAEIFASKLPKEQVYHARVITGFIRPQQHAVDITVHAEPIYVGSLYVPELKTIQPLCEAITAGDIPCQVAPDIAKALWAKMLYNCALNPLSAICRVPYGKLGEQEHTRQIMNMIIREIFQVMQAVHFSTYWDSPEGYCHAFYTRLVPSTARHESSMLQDLRAGKRTEIDAFNGAIVKLGQQYQIAIPTNVVMYNLIKFLEKECQTSV
jgi:2-dehydropantoate 2-reductase